MYSFRKRRKFFYRFYVYAKYVPLFQLAERIEGLNTDVAAFNYFSGGG